jgi:hypothetical protein
VNELKGLCLNVELVGESREEGAGKAASEEKKEEGAGGKE